MFKRIRPIVALCVATGLAVAACQGAAGPSPSPSPSPSAAAAFDACLVGSWTVVGQTESSPANDEAITYKGGAGEVYTIDASGGVTIDTHAAQPVDFTDSAGNAFRASVAGTGRGTITTLVSGPNRYFRFEPSADDTRTTHSVDSTGAELGPPRPDTAFSAIYTCAPGRLTFYKTAVDYMIDGPILTLRSGNAAPPAASPPAS